MNSTRMNPATEVAGEWVTEVQAGPLNEQRARQFAQWLKQSPTHVHEFLECLAVWESLEGVSIELDTSVSKLIENVVSLPTELQSQSEAPRKRARWGMGALAASALIAVALAATVLAPSPAAPERVETAVGEQRSITLADGSLLTLNTQSAAEVLIDGDTRAVELIQGEALFDVQRDPERPFTVTVGDTLITVVGTQFNVRRESDVVVVTVVEGQVSVNSNAASTVVADSAPALLGRGQQASVSAGVVASIEQTDNLQDTTAWTERRLVFRNDTLSDVVREFNRYNRDTFELAGPTISGERVSGVFKSSDTQSLIGVIEVSFDVEIERLPSGTVVIRQK
ncbi:MAG: FecR domain-containing protein [Pseudomonadota bacterium]